MSNWGLLVETLTPLAPVKVEAEPHGGTKLCIVSMVSGRLLCKVQGNRAADRAIADAIAASINLTARALARRSAA